MKIRRFVIMIVALLFATGLFAGCGAKSENYAAMDAPAADAPAEAPLMEMAGDSLSSTSDMGQPALPENEKIITTLYLDAQTEDMEGILSSIREQIAQTGGYIEAQEIYNGSAYSTYRYRHAYLTIRIPAEKLSGFVDHVSQAANIVSENTTTENITLTYVATESRIAALETERDRLMELMEMAEDMEDLLLIEQRLTEVLSELEQVTSQLRLYDNLVSYSTVHLNIEEVKEYTPVEEEPETVWQRIASGFGKSLKNLGEALVDIFVFLIVKLPYLVILGGIAVVVVIVIRRIRARKRDRIKKTKEKEQEQQ